MKMQKILLLAAFIYLALSRSYPMYKQCDSQWGKDELGHSGQTICAIGCLMSCVAMGLTGTGHSYNPGTLNKWLTANGGYSGPGLNPDSVGPLGLSWEGKYSKSEIKAKLDAGKVVAVNVNGGKHWVLAHSYSGDNINVNDPYFDKGSYSLSEI